MPICLRAAACLLTSVVALATLAPVQAAVPPPKLQYQITTLPNGLRVILSEGSLDTDCARVGLVSRRIEERARGADGLCPSL